MLPAFETKVFSGILNHLSTQSTEMASTIPTPNVIVGTVFEVLLAACWTPDHHEMSTPSSSSDVVVVITLPLLKPHLHGKMALVNDWSVHHIVPSCHRLRIKQDTLVCLEMLVAVDLLTTSVTKVVSTIAARHLIASLGLLNNHTAVGASASTASNDGLLGQ
mmetsp:Transcript_22173/g.36745  ORF Transcript_22173/g.36745 Transcript_22173/m.36745 type:complete len:162 (+) Transcript_22173:33-518(+)